MKFNQKQLEMKKFKSKTNLKMNEIQSKTT